MEQQQKKRDGPVRCVREERRASEHWLKTANKLNMFEAIFVPTDTLRGLCPRECFHGSAPVGTRTALHESIEWIRARGCGGALLRERSVMQLALHLRHCS